MLILIDLSIFLGDYNSKVKKFFRILSVVLIAALPLASARPAYAASASLSLSPSSASISNGSSITVSIRVNVSGGSTNGVQANLSYPSNLLDFVSIGSSSAFSVVAQNSGGSGSVKVGRGALPAVSGSQLVATVTFRAKASSGTANINFAGGTYVTNASTNAAISSSKSGASYTLRAPAAPAPPPPSKPADKIPPTIKTVASSEEKFTSAVITWVTSEPSTSEVQYGPTDGYGITYVNKKLVTNHKVVLSSAILVPGVEYHYRVKSVDSSGNASSSGDSTFSTKGANLLITVVNQDNKPVSGARVTLREKSGTTGSNGRVTLEGLPEGKLAGSVEFQGQKTAVETDVASIDPEGDPQPVTFKIETKGISPWIIVVLLGGLLAAAVVFLRRRGGGGSGSGLGGIGKHLSGLVPGKGKSHPVNTANPPASGGNGSQSEPAVIRPTQPPNGTGG